MIETSVLESKLRILASQQQLDPYDVTVTRSLMNIHVCVPVSQSALPCNMYSIASAAAGTSAVQEACRPKGRYARAQRREQVC